MHIAIAVIIVGLGLAGGSLGYLFYTGGFDQNTDNLDPITMFPPATRFSLTDHTGKAVSDEDYRGKFMLIAYGYTFCPDICPTGLMDMTLVMNALGKQAEWVQPIFITIDPARDTPQVMREYVDAFHPKFIGLTGTAQQIASAAESSRAYYFKNETSDAAGEDKDDDDYSMGHTTSIYLVGPDGRGLAVFNFGMAATAVEEMTSRIRHFVNVQEALAKAKQAGE